jgi:hypothetical protein
LNKTKAFETFCAGDQEKRLGDNKEKDLGKYIFVI